MIRIIYSDDPKLEVWDEKLLRVEMVEVGELLAAA
jgi:hypothetical protein